MMYSSVTAAAISGTVSATPNITVEFNTLLSIGQYILYIGHSPTHYCWHVGLHVPTTSITVLIRSAMCHANHSSVYGDYTVTVGEKL